MTDYSDLVAEFMAKKGVTRVPTGARAYDDRALYVAAREGGKAVSLSEREEMEAGRAERQWEAGLEAFREGRMNGLSTSDALDQMRDYPDHTD